MLQIHWRLLFNKENTWRCQHWGARALSRWCGNLQLSPEWMSWEMKGYRRFWISLALGLQNITEYMIIRKPLKLSLVWDVVGHSSLNRSEVIWEWTQMLDTERQKMRREEQVLGSLTKWKKSWKSLIKFEISLSKNIKENVSKFGIL